MRTEKALALSAPEFLRAGIPAKRCRLLYLGDEFCSNLLPDQEAFGRAMDACGGGAVLVTPLLTDEDLDRLEPLVRKFSSARRRLEIVANDLGLLRVLRGPLARRVSVSLGRVLGHRVKVMPAGFAGEFLKEHNISRVEIDDPALLGRFEGFGLPLSYHRALRYISTTRFCPWELHWPGPCSLTCLGKTRRLEHRRLPSPLVLKGLAYGIRGCAAPAHPLLDRVVEERVPSGRSR